jgi:hypothetical protein
LNEQILIIAGPPAWFVGLPGEVQTYFITAGGAASSAAVSISSLSSISSKTSSLSSVGTSRAASSTALSGTAANQTGANQPSESKSSSGGISTGAKAGIGIGVAVVVILAVCLGFFILRRHKRKVADAPYADDKLVSHPTFAPGAGVAYTGDRKELPANEEVKYNLLTELDSNSPQSHPAELDSNTPRPAISQISGNSPQPVTTAFDSQGPVATELISNPQRPAAELSSAAIGAAAVQGHHSGADGNNKVPNLTVQESQGLPRGASAGMAPGFGVAADLTSAGSSVVGRTPSMSEKEFVPSSMGSGTPTQSPMFPNDQLTTLREEQARLTEKRKRLEALQAIEAQEEELKRKIQELEGTGTTHK